MRSRCKRESGTRQQGVSAIASDLHMRLDLTAFKIAGSVGPQAQRVAGTACTVEGRLHYIVL